MKLNQILIIVFFLSFKIISNSPIPITNFEEITIPVGTIEYIYQFSEPNLEKGKNAYFFFKFSFYYKIEFKIIDENENETIIDVNTEYRYLYHHLTSLKSQNYTFIFINNYKEQTMHFIDNTKEININSDTFFTFVFKAESIKDYPPSPLIFNIDSINGRTIARYYENKEDYIVYEANDIIEYCEIIEDECNFIGFDNKIILEKDKKYKIKINWYKNKYDSYLFNASMMPSIMKEINFGLSYYSLNPKVENYYYIINIKDYENFYAYVNHNYYDFSINFLDEYDKAQLMENDVKYTLNYGLANEIIKKNKENDYLVIKIRNLYSPYNGYIYLFNSVYNLNSTTQLFEIKKGTYGIIKKEKDLKKYILVSSNKNLAIFDKSLNTQDLTNIIYMDNLKEDLLVYVDSSKEKTKIKFYNLDE